MHSNTLAAYLANLVLQYYGYPFRIAGAVAFECKAEFENFVQQQWKVLS